MSEAKECQDDWQLVSCDKDIGQELHVDVANFVEPKIAGPSKMADVPFVNLPDSETSKEASSDSTTDSEATVVTEAGSESDCSSI